MTRCPFFCGAFTLLDLEWFPQNGVFTDVFPDPPVCTGGLLSVACWSPSLLSLSTITETGHLSPCGRENSSTYPHILHFFFFKISMLLCSGFNACYSHLSIFRGLVGTVEKCPLFVILSPWEDHPFPSGGPHRCDIVAVDTERPCFSVFTFLCFIYTVCAVG